MKVLITLCHLKFMPVCLKSHAQEVILSMVSKRQNPQTQSADQDEAFIQENADILPPEVALVLSHKKRREVCKKIREKREVGKSPMDIGPTYEKDDETFIEEK